MATTKEITKNAFISLGLIGSKLSDGTFFSTERFIVIPERFAKYLGAAYTTVTPPPRKVTIKKGKLAGRIKSVEYSGKLSGRKYHFGYFDDKVPILKGPKGKRKIVWIPIHVPRYVATQTFLKLFLPHITKKPAFLRTPDGVTTRFNNVN
jgi:hypothetical protein